MGKPHTEQTKEAALARVKDMMNVHPGWHYIGALEASQSEECLQNFIAKEDRKRYFGRVYERARSK